METDCKVWQKVRGNASTTKHFQVLKYPTTTSTLQVYIENEAVSMDTKKIQVITGIFHSIYNEKVLRNYFATRRRQCRGQTRFKASEKVGQFYEW